mmetsp:Transcript_21471/g.38980  ORF Transcript_21471/g.38980 Transcript_21471/m.38980 type:complete len:213 (-) Transcript_21471:1042-1680(-)
MQHCVNTPVVCTTDVNDVRGEYVSVLFVEIHPLLHNSLRCIRVKEPWTPPARHDAEAKILSKSPFIVLDVFRQWGKACIVPTRMVINQRYEHPSLSDWCIVGVVKHASPGHQEVLPSGKAVLVLIIAHASLARSEVEVAVRLMDVHAPGFQIFVELCLQVVLAEDAVTQACMILVSSACTRLTPIGTVGLHNRKPSLIDEAAHSCAQEILPS